MKCFNPVVLLLSMACLAAGSLIFSDSSTAVVVDAAGPLKSVEPLPGYLRPAGDEQLLDVGMAESTTPENSETHARDQLTEQSIRTLSIHVSGLKSQSSTLYIAVFDSAEGFPKPEHSRTTTTIPISADHVDFTLPLPDRSETGIAVFQDLNGDGKLTKNSFGLPMEPYGFSNNARSAFGPPSFSEAAFLVAEQMPSMEIRVH